MDQPESEMRSNFPSTVGGIMTREVGAVTGELEISTRPEQEVLEVLVRYAEAEEWYAVEGGPVALGDARSLTISELRELHERIVSHLRQPAPVVRGNEEPNSLRGFSL